MLLQLVAKELLTGYRDRFGELDTARHGAVRRRPGGRDACVERTALRALVQRLVDARPDPRTSDADLLDRAWQVEMFACRERHLLETLARRLRRAADADDPFAVFNAAQDHLLALGRAHVERTVLDAFVSAIDECVDGDVAAAARPTLRPVRAVDRSRPTAAGSWSTAG